MTSDPSAAHLRRAFLASARDELLAPANAIRETCRSILDDFGDQVEESDRGPQSFLEDLRKVGASADCLVQLVEETFAPVSTGIGRGRRGGDDFGRTGDGMTGARV